MLEKHLITLLNLVLEKLLTYLLNLVFRYEWSSNLEYKIGSLTGSVVGRMMREINNYFSKKFQNFMTCLESNRCLYPTFTSNFLMIGNVIISDVEFTCVLPKTVPKLIQKHLMEKRMPLSVLDQNVKKSQASAFAVGTFSNLTTQWVKYLCFSIHYQMTPLPVSVEDLCRYAQYLDHCFKSHQSVRNYLSGVKTLHVLLGFSTTSFQSKVFAFTLQGMRRNNTYTKQQAPPITVQILEKIYHLLDFSNEDDVIFWAVVLIGFFLLLRKCNLVPDTANSFNPNKQLKRQDFTFLHDHARVQLTWTKNNQFGEEALVFSCLLYMTPYFAQLAQSYRCYIWCRPLRRIPYFKRVTANATHTAIYKTNLAGFRIS